MFLTSLTYISYAIICDTHGFFIPGNRIDCTFKSEFDDLSTDYYPTYDYPLGTGWLFDREGIEAVKEMFAAESVPYVEIKLTEITIHNP